MKHRTNTEKVLDIVTVLDVSSCTRAEIAEKLAISLSGVSNIISEMKTERIIGEYKSKTGNGSSIYLKNDPVFAMANISRAKIDTVFFGYNLKISGRTSFPVDDTLFFDNCIITYFKLLSSTNPKLRHLCITSDGIPDRGCFRNTGIDSLDGLPITEYAHEFMSNTIVTLENKLTFIPHHYDGMCAIISHTDDILSSTIIHNGVNISCTNNSVVSNSPFGLNYKESVQEKLKYSASPDEYASAVASLVNIISSLIQLDRIYFITDRYSSIELCTNTIEAKSILEHGASPITMVPVIPIPSNEALFPERLLRKIRYINIDYIFN